MSFEMDATVSKYGDAIVIRLPIKTAKAMGVNPGDQFRIRMQRLKLVPVEDEKLESPLRRKSSGNLFSGSLKRVGAARVA